MPVIEVNNVSKEFKVLQRPKGVLPSLKSLFHRSYTKKRAVDGISFSINQGEVVGYLGLNGSGKSTTIKMLTGILVPTTGTVLINGKEPFNNRQENAKKIGVVFGQRSQLYWSLPMEETFDLYRKIYKVDVKKFEKNKEYLVDMLDMKQFLRTPVRQLSLGQRMRAELVVALLHDPDILYLDEPTIGLDIFTKQKIREFIRELKCTRKTTIILTTHDMDDIEETCDRIITIDNGCKIYDGDLQEFKDAYSYGHTLIIDFQDEQEKEFDSRLKLVNKEGNQIQFSFDKREIAIAEVISSITQKYEIKDLSIIEPKIEDAIRQLLSK